MHRSAGKGNGFELTRKAREQQPSLKVVVLALGDAIPVEYANASWLEAIVAEARGLRHHSYRSASLRSGHLPYLSCPRLTPREYEVLDLLAQGMTDREIAEALTVSEQTSRT